MLDPRAIATLGIGYGAALVARIGLWPGRRRRSVLDPRAIATLGIGYGAALVARIGLWPGRRRRGSGMSYDQVLAATIDYRKHEKTLAELRKKKRRGRRAREREHLMLIGGGWPL